jgi:hypothetical protein
VEAANPAMGTVVVEHQLDIQIGGNSSIDLLQEIQKLDRTVASITLTEIVAGGNIERSEQAGNAVPSSRGCAAPTVRPAWAEPAMDGSEPESVTSHRRITPAHDEADLDTVQQCPAPCRSAMHRWKAENPPHDADLLIPNFARRIRARFIPQSDNAFADEAVAPQANRTSAGM